jgi:hypothetical protein
MLKEAKSDSAKVQKWESVKTQQERSLEDWLRRFMNSIYTHYRIHPANYKGHCST